jgi:Tfp pilus assembly protein PilN
MMKMMKLDYQANVRNRLMGMALLVMGLFALLVMGWVYQDASQKAEQQEILLNKLMSASAARTEILPARKDTEQVAQEIKQANSVIFELNLPWKELFEAFEVTQNSDIAVLSIEPDAQKGLVRISGEAKSLDSLPAYLDYLQKIPLFKDVALLNHQIQQQDPQQPVRFMLQATWSVLR